MTGNIAERNTATLTLMVLVLSGALLVIVAFLVRSSTVAFTVLLSLGAALLVAVVVTAANRLIPSPSQRVRLLETHSEIYNEFEKLIVDLDKAKPHTIRTINSFLAEPELEKSWDDFVTTFLRQNPESQFIRVIAYRDVPEWNARLERLKARYHGIKNYHQMNWSRPSLPTPEIFLLDTNQVIFSFATEDVDNPRVSYGILLRDRDLCTKLEVYHRVQLEQALPKESFG